ncbi:MAG: hypothetical protein ABIH77_02585 [Pseudomonadota bacterium]|nr:hypothetical protein [Gammaproteobacteria bacterium]MBU1628491.1 hypothetical protein [Gammaproteobacteria bacterium]MBU2546690.1 hypothetical protein [Gammaproteobacteria bacterium]
MLKQSIALIIASLLVVLSMKYLHQGLEGIAIMHAYMVNGFGKLFAGGASGYLAKNAIVLFVIPFVIAGIVSGIYWLFKKGGMPYVYHVMWALWIVLATVVICEYSPMHLLFSTLS